MDKLREADSIVDSLGKAMQSGETGLRYVPALLVRVINEDMWRDRVIVKTGERVGFKTFKEFVETPPLEGLGADIDTLRRLCSSNIAALDALNKHAYGGRGGNNNPSGSNQYKTVNDNNIIIDRDRTSPVGTSRVQALHKLRSDAPELHTRVLAGDLSPHAAMIEAGFRKKMISIPVGNVRATALTLARHFTPEQIDELIAILQGE
jgi:hypothetical protein